jgi:hypothetical protein
MSVVLPERTDVSLSCTHVFGSIDFNSYTESRSGTKLARSILQRSSTLHASSISELFNSWYKCFVKKHPILFRLFDLETRSKVKQKRFFIV